VKKINWSHIIWILILIWFIAFAICILYPFFWMIITGFKTKKELFMNTWALPDKWLFSNYVQAWKIGVGRYFFNSVFVTSTSIVLTVIISALCSFGLSRYDFKLKKALVIIMVGGLMLSPQVSLISLYKMLQKLGIYNTYLALIIPYVAYRIPFTTFLMKTYFDSIPREVEESAYLDGCSSFMVFLNIILPLSKPIIFTSALFSGMMIWNEFMFALVFIEDSSLKTIPLGLMNLKGSLYTDWTILVAALALSAIPMIICFLLLQKHFIRGLTAGGVKS